MESKGDSSCGRRFIPHLNPRRPRGPASRFFKRPVDDRDEGRGNVINPFLAARRGVRAASQEIFERNAEGMLEIYGG